MNQFISMGFKSYVPVILDLRGAAEYTIAILPGVQNTFEADVTLRIVEFGYRLNTVRVFAAICAAPRQQAGQLCDGNAVKLVMKYMVNPLLQVGH